MFLRLILWPGPNALRGSDSPTAVGVLFRYVHGYVHGQPTRPSA
jgi:hypothetical protein